MRDFCMAALMFLTGHRMEARTHGHVEIAHFPTRRIIRAWEARGCRLSAFHILMIDAPHWKMCDFHTGMGSG